MSDQQARLFAAQPGGGEIGEIARIAVEFTGPRAGRQTARPHRAALAAPVEAPHRDAAVGEVAHRLHLLFDEFAEAADHHALGARVADRQVAPAQHRAIGRGEITPDEFRRRQKALGERRPADRFTPRTCRQQAVGHA
jgi:hypothetical protein